MSCVIFAGTKMLPVELIVEETDFFLFGVLLIKLILWIFEPDRIIILIIFIIVVIFFPLYLASFQITDPSFWWTYQFSSATWNTVLWNEEVCLNGKFLPVIPPAY